MIPITQVMNHASQKERKTSKKAYLNVFEHLFFTVSIVIQVPNDISVIFFYQFLFQILC